MDGDLSLLDRVDVLRYLSYRGLRQIGESVDELRGNFGDAADRYEQAYQTEAREMEAEREAILRQDL